MNDSILARYTDGDRRTVPATPGPSRTRLLGCVVALIALMVFLCAGAAWAVDFETRQAESASALPAGTYLYDDPQIVTIGKDSVVYENDATVDYRFSVGQYRTVKQIAVRSRTDIASNTNVDINLVVDGQPLAPKTIPKDATSYQDRTWAVNLPSGDHTIGVRGTNLNAHD